MEKQDPNLNQLLEEALDDLLQEKAEDDDDTEKVSVMKTEMKKKEEEERLTKGEREKVVDEEKMDDFFRKMTSELQANLPNGMPNIEESVPQIFDLMQNLLSKELLYPALKDLSPKFDEWLKKNSPNLSKEDKKRYREQRDIINEIIEVFDDETIDAQERFEKNLNLMEKMQTLGSPPEELTVPDGVPKCSIM